MYSVLVQVVFTGHSLDRGLDEYADDGLVIDSLVCRSKDTFCLTKPGLARTAVGDLTLYK